MFLGVVGEKKALEGLRRAKDGHGEEGSRTDQVRMGMVDESADRKATTGIPD